MSESQQYDVVRRLCGGVSHELSNFMNALSLGRQLLQQQIDDEDAGRSLHQLSDLEEQMDELKERLNLLRLPEPKRCQTVNARDIIPQIVSSLSERFDIQLTGPDGQTEDPITVDVDVQALRQLLAELVENASRQDGGQTIRISLTEEDGTALISVIDEGSGLSDDLTGPATEPFVTSDDERLGLGLTIADQIALGHDGTLHINSTTSGVTITLALPCTNSTAPSHATS